MRYYLLNSKPTTHVLFWIAYYVFFGFVWARNDNYLDSYFLEFVLLPIRVMAVYFMVYFIIPRYLEREKYLGFGVAYGLLLLICGFLQNIFTFYYRGFLGGQQESIFALGTLFRNVILVNSTVVVVGSFKIFLLWVKEREEKLALKQESNLPLLEVKADKRIFRLNPSDIFYIEGLGNYVTYHLKDKKLISHGSLTETEAKLPDNFIRIHKSYIVNRNHISSYNNEDIEIKGVLLPIGRILKGKLF
jgi:two-component system, LytTR family, response regulator LytT